MRMIGWRLVSEGDPATLLWEYTDLGEFLCTLSAAEVGLAGKLILATDLFADTITIVGTTANEGVSVDVVSPANDRAAHFTMDIKGSQLIEPLFKIGTATNANALLSLI